MGVQGYGLPSSASELMSVEGSECMRGLSLAKMAEA